jgi:hypothetical protein
LSPTAKGVDPDTLPPRNLKFNLKFSFKLKLQVEVLKFKLTAKAITTAL